MAPFYRICPRHLRQMGAIIQVPHFNADIDPGDNKSSYTYVCSRPDKSVKRIVSIHFGFCVFRTFDDSFDKYEEHNPTELPKMFVRGCEKFLPALAYQFCLALRGSCLARFTYYFGSTICMVFLGLCLGQMSFLRPLIKRPIDDVSWLTYLDKYF